jgi:hypothetical protein
MRAFSNAAYGVGGVETAPDVPVWTSSMMFGVRKTRVSVP